MSIWKCSHLFTGALLALGLSSGTVAQAAEPVRIGIVSWIGFTGFYLAEAFDTYKPYGVDVKLVVYPDNTTMLTEFDHGGVDLAVVTYEKVIEEVAHDNPLKVLLAIDQSNGGDAIVAPLSIQNISDLKDQAVGVEFLSPGALLLDYALMQNGLSISDVRPLNMDPYAVQAALEAARIAAGVSYEPFASTLVSAAGGHKFHILYSSRNAPGLISDVLVAKAPYIKSHHDVLLGVIKGYREGLATLKTREKEAEKVLAAALGVPRSEVSAQLELVRIPKLEDMSQNFEPTDDIGSFYTSGKVIGTVLSKRGKINKTPAIEDTLDNSLLKEVLHTPTPVAPRSL